MPHNGWRQAPGGFMGFVIFSLVHVSKRLKVDDLLTPHSVWRLLTAMWL